MLDAYTIKKVFPRLLIAAVLVNLSWYICIALLNTSNVLGEATKDIILGAFSLENPDIIGTMSGGQQATTGGVAVVAALGVTLFSSWAIFLPALLGALIALIIGYVVLVFRQIFIILMIMVSPIIAVLWIFPNTENIAKKWGGTYIKVLLMYPIIMALLASGRVISEVANTTSTTGSGGDWIPKLIAIIALFAPYFMIPLTFKFVGGAIASIGGFANDRSRGMIDSTRKWAAQKGATNRLNTKAGSRFAGKNPISRAANRAGGTVAVGPKAWMRGRPGVASALETNRAIAGAAMMESNATFKANKNNDQFLLAVADEDRAKRKKADAERKGDAMEAAGWTQALRLAESVPRNPAGRLAATQALAATGYQISSGQQGYNELAEMVANSTGAELQRDANNNVIGATGVNAGAYANAMNNAQYNLKGAGRFDLGGINGGTGYDFTKGIDKASSYTLGQGKPDNIKAGSEAYLGTADIKDEDTMRRTVTSTISRGGREDVKKLMNWHAKLVAAEPGATGANQEAISRQRMVIEGVVQSLNNGSTPNDEGQLDRITLAKTIMDSTIGKRRQDLDPAILEEQQKPPEPTPPASP